MTSWPALPIAQSELGDWGFDSLDASARMPVESCEANFTVVRWRLAERSTPGGAALNAGEKRL